MGARAATRGRPPAIFRKDDTDSRCSAGWMTDEYRRRPAAVPPELGVGPVPRRVGQVPVTMQAVWTARCGYEGGTSAPRWWRTADHRTPVPASRSTCGDLPPPPSGVRERRLGLEQGVGRGNRSRRGVAVGHRTPGEAWRRATEQAGPCRGRGTRRPGRGGKGESRQAHLPSSSEAGPPSWRRLGRRGPGTSGPCMELPPTAGVVLGPGNRKADRAFRVAAGEIHQYLSSEEIRESW